MAETGSLVMISGSENPSTLNFLPDNHIIVVSAKDIAGDYESVWTKIRYTFGKGGMPRTVNWITGPSRSGRHRADHAARSPRAASPARDCRQGVRQRGELPAPFPDCCALGGLGRREAGLNISNCGLKETDLSRLEL